MATIKQFEANKINAQNAGVKTEPGKSVIRHNAFKHGLTSKEIISDLKNYNETKEEFQNIVNGLRSTFSPRNYFEESLIHSMARSQFKLKRYEVLEATMFQDDDSILNPRDIILVKDISDFELILKYKQSLEAQFYRALESLHRARQSQQLDLFLPVEN